MIGTAAAAAIADMCETHKSSYDMRSAVSNIEKNHTLPSGVAISTASSWRSIGKGSSEKLLVNSHVDPS